MVEALTPVRQETGISAELRELIDQSVPALLDRLLAEQARWKNSCTTI
jgi:hypothetical protein